MFFPCSHKSINLLACQLDAHYRAELCELCFIKAPAVSQVTIVTAEERNSSEIADLLRPESNLKKASRIIRSRSAPEIPAKNDEMNFAT